MKVFVIFLVIMLIKTKMNLFNKYEHKYKIKFFSLNKLKFQPRT